MESLKILCFILCALCSHVVAEKKDDDIPRKSFAIPQAIQYIHNKPNSSTEKCASSMATYLKVVIERNTLRIAFLKKRIKKIDLYIQRVRPPKDKKAKLLEKKKTLEKAIKKEEKELSKILLLVEKAEAIGYRNLKGLTDIFISQYMDDPDIDGLVIPRKKKKKQKIITIAVYTCIALTVVAIIAGISVGGYFLYQHFKKQKDLLEKEKKSNTDLNTKLTTLERQVSELSDKKVEEEKKQQPYVKLETFTREKNNFVPTNTDNPVVRNKEFKDLQQKISVLERKLQNTIPKEQSNPVVKQSELNHLKQQFESTKKQHAEQLKQTVTKNDLDKELEKKYKKEISQIQENIQSLEKQLQTTLQQNESLNTEKTNITRKMKNQKKQYTDLNKKLLIENDNLRAILDPKFAPNFLYKTDPHSSATLHYTEDTQKIINTFSAFAGLYQDTLRKLQFIQMELDKAGKLFKKNGKEPNLKGLYKQLENLNSQITNCIPRQSQKAFNKYNAVLTKRNRRTFLKQNQVKKTKSLGNKKIGKNSIESITEQRTSTYNKKTIHPDHKKARKRFSTPPRKRTVSKVQQSIYTKKKNPSSLKFTPPKKK